MTIRNDECRNDSVNDQNERTSSKDRLTTTSRVVLKPKIDSAKFLSPELHSLKAKSESLKMRRNNSSGSICEAKPP